MEYLCRVFRVDEVMPVAVHMTVRNAGFDDLLFVTAGKANVEIDVVAWIGNGPFKGNNDEPLNAGEM